MAIIKNFWLIAGFASFSFGILGITLMFIGSYTANWDCKCNVPNHWSYTGSNGIFESEKHFDEFRHSTSCKRIDWPIVVLDKLFDLIQ
jgi:hypothetical protein